MGDSGLGFCLKSAGSTMPSRFQGRLSPLAREALAEVMATFILVVSTHYNEHFNFSWIYLLFFLVKSTFVLLFINFFLVFWRRLSCPEDS